MTIEQNLRYLQRQVDELRALIHNIQIPEIDCCKCAGAPYYRQKNFSILNVDEFGNYSLPEGFNRITDTFPEGCTGGKDTDKAICFYQDCIVFCEFVSPEDINDPNTGWIITDWIRKA